MNLIFQTWAHIKKDLLIYETPLAQIKENRMNEKLKILISALFAVAGTSFLAWTIYDVFFK
jgi:hypothetical protein